MRFLHSFCRWACFLCFALLALPALADESPVQIVHVTTNKVHYLRGEAGSAQVTLTNTGAQALTLSLEGEITQELARATPFPAKAVTLPAGKELTVDFPFTAPMQDYGGVIAVRAVQGGTVLARGQEMFGVSDALWNIAIGANVTDWMDQTGWPWTNPANGLKIARAQYFNWWEKMFWSPDMFGNLTPAEERWYSGQGGRDEIKTVIKRCAALAKANGIASITYSINTSGGPAGWEIARRHPDWYLSGENGQPRGIFDTDIFARWNSKERFDRGWWYAYPDLTRDDVLNHAIDEFLRSSAEYGWDGVRFDGNFTWVGDDELGAYNQRRVKERLWEKYPQFSFGFNMGFSPSEMDYRKWSHAVRECIVGGGHYMQEAIGIANYGYASNGRYSSYRDYWTKESLAADAIRRAGASYHFIYYSHPTLQSQYKFILGTSAGTHPVYGDTAVVPGCANWGRFLTRWSALVWDTNLRNLPDTDVVVTAPTPLWQMVKERPADTQTRMTIVHLIVPPTTDDVDAKTVALGAPATHVGVRIHIPAGQPVLRAALIAPEHPDDAQPLTTRRDGDWVEVTVPEVKSWSMVAIESQGKFTLPTYAKFTEPIDMARVKRARESTAHNVVSDPLRPENSAFHTTSKLRVLNTAQLYQTQAKVEPDKDAACGACSRIDYTMSNSGIIDHAIFDGVTAGHYRATYRFKLKSKTDDAGKPVYVAFMLYAYFGAKEVQFKNIGLNDFKTPGQYEDFPVEFDFSGESSTINLIAFWLGNQGRGTVYADTISLEQLSRFSDDDLEQRMRRQPGYANRADVISAAKLVPGGGPGLGVLAVNGLYADMYRLPAALSSLGTVQDITDLPGKKATPLPANPDEPAVEAPPAPTTPPPAVRARYCPVTVLENAASIGKYPTDYRELCQYDVVVLTNADAAWLQYAGRTALRDFVRAGGGLLVLGGSFTLGQGNFPQSFLAELLPVTVVAGRDVQLATMPLPLRPAPTGLARSLPAQVWNTPTFLYWRHRATLKAGAQTQLFAGDEPLLITGSYGKGRVAVFTGTVLGEPTGKEQPFWQWSGWPLLLGKTVQWLGSAEKPVATAAEPRVKVPIKANDISLNFYCKLSDGTIPDANTLVIDGNLATGIRRTGDGAGAPGAYLQIDFRQPRRVTQIRLASVAKSALIAAPENNSWGQPCGPTLLRGSQNGRDWTTLLTLPTVSADDRALWYEFPVESETHWRHLQLYGGNFTISELEVWGEREKTDD